MDTDGVTYEELVTIMGHIMPEPEVEIREGLTSALWRFGKATNETAVAFAPWVHHWVPFAWKLAPSYQRYMLRYNRQADKLRYKPRPSKRHGERRGVR